MPAKKQRKKRPNPTNSEKASIFVSISFCFWSSWQIQTGEQKRFRPFGGDCELRASHLLASSLAPSRYPSALFWRVPPLRLRSSRSPTSPPLRLLPPLPSRQGARAPSLGRLAARHPPPSSVAPLCYRAPSHPSAAPGPSRGPRRSPIAPRRDGWRVPPSCPCPCRVIDSFYRQGRGNAACSLPV